MSDAIDTLSPSVTPSDATPAATPAPEATPAPAAPVEDSKPSLDELLSKTYDDHNKAPQSPAAPQAAAPTGETEPSVSDQPASAGPEPGQSSPAIAAPHSWSAEAKATWTKLPPEAQDYIARRESEIHRAITQAGQELKTYEPLRPVYDALNQHWGVPQGREAEVIHSWARAQHALDTNPVEALRWLAQSYNVDPAQLVGQGKAPATEPGIDDLFKDPRIDSQVLPFVQALQKKLDDVDRQQRQTWAQQQAREHAEADQRKGYVSQVISTFAQGKPYFAELEDAITDEVRIIKARDPKLPPDKVLEKAYDKAVWGSPTHRQRILDDQRKAEEAKAKTEQAKKQADAKKLSSMNVRSGVATPSTTMPGKFLDDDKLNAIYDRINAG